MAYKTIGIIDDGSIQKEALAGEAITPGALIEYSSTAGDVVNHSTANGNAQRMFAVESDLDGSEIGTVAGSENYPNNAIVLYRIFQRGNEVYAILTTSQTVAIGDFLVSAGDGRLQEDTASSAGIVEYAESIVAVAVEAVTTTSDEARIRVEIV